MKQCLLTAVGLFVAMGAILVLLMSPGATLQMPEQETVLSISASETATQPPENVLTFPISIPDTTLTAKSLALYEGDMLETDSDTHLIDAAALEVENYGSREVEIAHITLQFGTEEMHFFGTNLLPDSTTLMVEMDGKLWKKANCTGCSGWVQYGDDPQLLDTEIKVTEVDMGTIRVENISQQIQENIMLYHKNYLYDAELYLGGITYQTYIGTLAPGEALEITPYRYASGYSKIVKAVLLT